MIEYQKGTYLWNILFRSSGSALYRAMVPGLLSVAIFLLIDEYWITQGKEVEHPYGIGVLVSSISFLIIFRANYGYQRYWEATSATHQCLSKWLDAAIHTGVYHMQCKHYDSIKPPSLFDHPDLNRYQLTRDRESNSDYSAKTKRDVVSIGKTRRVVRSIEYVKDEKKRERALTEDNDLRNVSQRRMDLEMNSPGTFSSTETDSVSENHNEKRRLLGPGRLDGGWGLLFPDDVRGPTATYYTRGDEDIHGSAGDQEGFASTKGGRTPSLFLQELAHLSSLCAAVALSTLRNDVEGAESPLGIYEAGAPWPEADPDKCPKEVKRDFLPNFWKNIRHALLLDRGEQSRIKYNTARPMMVIGGVSENEIAFLQKARGASAKTTLVWGWLSEFVMREQLAGSLGKVAPPIISRIFQFLSDGMIFYNHARKVMYVPFPFPHAQLSVFFIMTLLPTVPLLMNQYTGERWLGALLTFLTVTCLAGLHEVARELENPFRNVPNDLPLSTFLAFFNESLITMYAGYHPDHYWDPQSYEALGDGVNMGKPRPVAANHEEKKDENNKGQSQTAQVHDSPLPVPSSTNEGNVPSGQANEFEEMQKMIETQSEEIARLRQLVENPPSAGSSSIFLSEGFENKGDEASGDVALPDSV